MMNTIVNPILKGFNPDPSMIRVDDDFYIATSTFEWFPGIQIHHSKDLVNWRLLTRPLRRISQVDMKGVPDSCGVWAPCLSYHQGTFYLVYSIVRTFDGVWIDVHNYLITTQQIDTEWSDPIYLNSSGFDASLFHDDDGKKWIINMLVDHRNNKFFGGIVLQEFSPHDQKLIRPVYHIYDGTELGKTEGPHIYKRNGWYYLLTAEGGTEYGHAVSLARSRKITGPYETHPENPIISSRYNPKLELQKTGHASIIETKEGECYASFLVGRPLTELGRCILGRETALAQLEWRNDDWLYMKSGGREPDVEISAPDLPGQIWPKPDQRDNFDIEELNIHFQSLRVPMTEDWITLKERPGYLRLYGREALCSYFEQSLIARRQQDFHVIVSTCLEFYPTTFQQMAGLVCYYNTKHFHYLYLSWNEKSGQRTINILTNDYMKFREPVEELPVKSNGAIYLRAEINREQLQFYYAEDENLWRPIGSVLDASILSDDYVQQYNHDYEAAFTGNFIGMCCQDVSGQRLHADFDWFEYVEESSEF